MFGALSRSFQLVKESFKVLQKDKEIMLFPLISGIITILLFVSFVAPIYFFVGIENLVNNYLYYSLLFLYYFISYFVVVFFNAGLITCANMRLNGKDPTFGDGFNNATRHLGKIFLWVLISATIGLVLRYIANRTNTVGRIIVAITGMAWSLLTFFVLPVLVLENKSVVQSIKTSGNLFKKTWGENVIGQVSISTFFGILAMLGVMILAIAFITGSLFIIVSGVLVTVLYWSILVLVSSSLGGIFTTALYQYANTGKISPVYSPDFIKSAFKQKVSTIE